MTTETRTVGQLARADELRLVKCLDRRHPEMAVSPVVSLPLVQPDAERWLGRHLEQCPHPRDRHEIVPVVRR